MVFKISQLGSTVEGERESGYDLVELLAVVGGFNLLGVNRMHM